jgi:hypothetical protein
MSLLERLSLRRGGRGRGKDRLRVQSAGVDVEALLLLM